MTYLVTVLVFALDPVSFLIALGIIIAARNPWAILWGGTLTGLASFLLVSAFSGSMLPAEFLVPKIMAGIIDASAAYGLLVLKRRWSAN